MNWYYVGFVLTVVGVIVLLVWTYPKAEPTLAPSHLDIGPPSIQIQTPPTPVGRIAHWGKKCFVEYRPAEGQQWEICRYSLRGGYCLDREVDALELMRRIDGEENV